MERYTVRQPEGRRPGSRGFACQSVIPLCGHSASGKIQQGDGSSFKDERFLCVRGTPTGTLVGGRMPTLGTAQYRITEERPLSPPAQYRITEERPLSPLSPPNPPVKIFFS